jgi:hypothetical protein
MLQLKWLVGGLIIGMLISTILIPPTRKESRVPMPNDPSTYHTPTGCVQIESMEVPCVDGADSLNLLASK